MKQADVLLTFIIINQDDIELVKKCISNASKILSRNCKDYEIIVIDNNTNDFSKTEVENYIIKNKLKNTRIYYLTKTLTKNYAYFVGVENALGDYVITFNPLLHDIQKIKILINELQKGYEIIFAINNSINDESIFYKFLKKLFYIYLSFFTDIKYSTYSTEFRLISRNVINYLLRQSHPKIIFNHMSIIPGFKKKNFFYESKILNFKQYNTLSNVYSGFKLLMTVNKLPIRIVTYLSFLGAILNLSYSFYVLIIYITSNYASGWVSLSLQQSGMFFLISMVLLIISEYLIHLTDDLSNDSKFIVSKEFNSDIQSPTKLNVKDIND